MNGQSSSKQANPSTSTIDMPTVFDISEALHRLADLVGGDRVRFTRDRWIITQVDWWPYLTDVILDVMTNVVMHEVERNNIYVITRYTGYIKGIFIEFQRGVRLKAGKVKPT